MVTLRPEPLTAKAFAPFGQVIEADHEKSYLINEGTTRRFHDLAQADVADKAGEAILSIFRGTPRPMPIAISMLERHPLGSQAFVPMQPAPWLIVVSEDENPTPESCRAFLATGCQGVQYSKNIWHHPLLVLDPTQDFLIVDRKGTRDKNGDNLEERWFEGKGAILQIP
ncbi:MAG: ureidoglycolate lyase [Halopseudomonas aestusnigri]